MSHMDFLDRVATSDVACLKEKETTYQGSWKKRGGIGAFMMLARKWDRLENMCAKHEYDIFKSMWDTSGKDGTTLAEIRDLRRYLMLVEAEILDQVSTKTHRDGTPKEDSNRHAADTSNFS